MSEILLEIPVKKHIKKYLESQCKVPFEVTLETSRRKDKQFDDTIKSYPEIFPVAVTRKQCFDKGMRSIGSRAAKNFNRLIELDFEKEFYRFIIVHHFILGYEIKQSIEQFNVTYNITDDDISYDGLKKKFERLHKKKKYKMGYKSALFIKIDD